MRGLVSLENAMIAIISATEINSPRTLRNRAEQMVGKSKARHLQKLSDCVAYQVPHQHHAAKHQQEAREVRQPAGTEVGQQKRSRRSIEPDPQQDGQNTDARPITSRARPLRKLRTTDAARIASTTTSSQFIARDRRSRDRPGGTSR